MAAKAISLWQPWATLVVHGFKEYETRSWMPHRKLIHEINFTGGLLIHAAKILYRDQIELCHEDYFKEALNKCGIKTANDLSRGAIIGKVKLVAIHRTQEIENQLSKQEIAFGDYSPNRFAWQLKEAESFDKPILYRGSQGFFNVERNFLA